MVMLNISISIVKSARRLEMKYLNLLTVILIVLKLANILQISWFVAFLPSIIWLALFIILFPILVILEALDRDTQKR